MKSTNTIQDKINAKSDRELLKEIKAGLSLLEGWTSWMQSNSKEFCIKEYPEFKINIYYVIHELEPFFFNALRDQHRERATEDFLREVEVIRHSLNELSQEPGGE